MLACQMHLKISKRPSGFVPQYIQNAVAAATICSASRMFVLAQIDGF